MTIIDTTIYANGELRLAQHGKGKGGNVLTHVPTNDQLALTDADVPKAVAQIEHMKGQVSSSILFSALKRIYEK